MPTVDVVCSLLTTCNECCLILAFIPFSFCPVIKLFYIDLFDCTVLDEVECNIFTASTSAVCIGFNANEARKMADSRIKVDF